MFEHPLAFIPGADLSYTIVFSADWSGYEDSGYQFILEKDGQYYDLSGGTSCMAEDNTPAWDPFPVSPDQALAIMLEWAEHEGPEAWIP